ncbi:MAG: hypothetical protein ACREOU_06355 [Candidatus Eiseniibacteriota bacterium]
MSENPLSTPPPGTPPRGAGAGAPGAPLGDDAPRPIAPRFIVFGVALLALAAAFLAGRRENVPAGNALVVVNAGAASIDSVIIEPDPPGQNPLSGRMHYVAARDSSSFLLPPGKGDADIRVWRGGQVVADHLAQFGGTTIFEVRVGDSTHLGRYRRIARPD